MKEFRGPISKSLMWSKKHRIMMRQPVLLIAFLMSHELEGFHLTTLKPLRRIIKIICIFQFIIDSLNPKTRKEKEKFIGQIQMSEYFKDNSFRCNSLYNRTNGGYFR